MASERVDKAWAQRGLTGYSTEAIVGTLRHYGIAIDEVAFKALAAEHYPLHIAARWRERWKATGQFAQFPEAAADELFTRWVPGQPLPSSLAVKLITLVHQLSHGEEPTAFELAEIATRQRPAGQARERFMVEVVHLLGEWLQVVDTLAEALAKDGKVELAQRFVQLEEALFPVRQGVSRALVQAESGQRDQALGALQAIADDASRDEYGRLAAVDALLHLNALAAAEPATLALMDKAAADDDLELAVELANRLKDVAITPVVRARLQQMVNRFADEPAAAG